MDVEDKNGPIINYCAQTFRNGDNVLFAPLFRLRPLYTNAIDLLCFRASISLSRALPIALYCLCATGVHISSHQFSAKVFNYFTYKS